MPQHNQNWQRGVSLPSNNHYIYVPLKLSVQPRHPAWYTPYNRYISLWPSHNFTSPSLRSHPIFIASSGGPPFIYNATSLSLASRPLSLNNWPTYLIYDLCFQYQYLDNLKCVTYTPSWSWDNLWLLYPVITFKCPDSGLLPFRLCFYFFT
jgi:hypothetical protein